MVYSRNFDSFVGGTAAALAVVVVVITIVVVLQVVVQVMGCGTQMPLPRFGYVDCIDT